MDYGTTTPQRERGTELFEIHSSLQQHGERIDKLLLRLYTVGNKLLDEDGVAKESLGASPKEPSPRLPGLLSNLYTDADGFNVLANKLEREVQKLEKLI